MPEPVKSEVTDEQAELALQQLVQQDPDESETTQEAPAEQAPKPPAEQPAEPVPAETEGETETEAAAAETDDVVSLKQRLEKAESEKQEVEKRFDSRLRALQNRTAENERILRERFLRKSTVADKALKILRAGKASESGVPEADVDRVIQELEGSMNPASASYAPSPPQATATEDQALILNGFLNEKGMTVEESEEFGKWIRSEASTVMSPAEQAVASQSLDGFLRLAHTRWQDGLSKKTKEAARNDAVGAVRSVQRTQKEAARAASAGAAAPRKQPASQKTEVDLKKLTENDISALLRKSVEQYR